MLADLVAGALEDAERRRAERPLADVEAEALARPAALDALTALAPADRVKIIAEVKRASPSRGALAEIPDPAALAVSYETGGASAISVLTEERRFHGSLADLEAVRDAVSIPVLRKDFIADPYQVFEARAAGADLVLLIVAALDQRRLAELHELITQLGHDRARRDALGRRARAAPSTSAPVSSASTPATSQRSSSTATCSAAWPTASRPASSASPSPP